MFIDRLGIVHEGIAEIPDDKVLEECFEVSVFDNEFNRLGAEHYQEFPSDDQIAWCICNYKGTQAKISKVFYFSTIPFA